jgi:hypothetical protein
MVVKFISIYHKFLRICTADPIFIMRVMISRRMRWAGHVARIGEGRGVHRVLVGKPEGKRPLRKPRCRWEDNNMDLQELGYGGMDWIGLA